MNWLDRAEARFGFLAIPGLPRIIVGFNLLVFILFKVSPSFVPLLELNPTLVLQGQVWRLVTFIFIPQFGGMLGEWLTILLYLLYLLFIGTGLEQAMGSFKLTLYYLMGMFGVAVAALLLGSAQIPGAGPTGTYAAGMLNSTLFFAFARYYPETIIYLMYILPVKVKWMAWFSAALLIFGFLGNGWDYRVSLLICLVNYLIFFGVEHYREARHRTETTTRRERFEADQQIASTGTLHECVVCGVTEVKDPYMDFRVARDGKEYCVVHLPKPAEQTA
jgi:membrane associated rhomboid family serine protease